MTSHLWQGTWRGLSPTGDAHVRSREIVRHSGGIVRGKFPSRKNGRMVHHEGLLELDAVYLFETSPRIVRYREQPELVRYADGAKLRKYTPDFELALDTGEIVQTEVKPRSSLEHEEVAHKIAQLHAHFDRSGRLFVVLTDEVLRVEPRQSNLRWICHQAPRVRPTRMAIQAAVRRMKDSFPMTLQDAKSVMRFCEVDPFSALMEGVLTCDLSGPISSETLVNPTEESSHEWFRIAHESGF